MTWSRSDFFGQRQVQGHSAHIGLCVGGCLPKTEFHFLFGKGGSRIWGLRGGRSPFLSTTFLRCWRLKDFEEEPFVEWREISFSTNTEHLVGHVHEDSKVSRSMLGECCRELSGHECRIAGFSDEMIKTRSQLLSIGVVQYPIFATLFVTIEFSWSTARSVVELAVAFYLARRPAARMVRRTDRNTSS